MQPNVRRRVNITKILKSTLGSQVWKDLLNSDAELQGIC